MYESMFFALLSYLGVRWFEDSSILRTVCQVLTVVFTIFAVFQAYRAYKLYKRFGSLIFWNELDKLFECRKEVD